MARAGTPSAQSTAVKEPAVIGYPNQKGVTIERVTYPARNIGTDDRRQSLQAGRLPDEPQVRGDRRDSPVRRREGADGRPLRPAPGRAGLRDARLRRLLPGGERRRAAADGGSGAASRRHQLRHRLPRQASPGRCRADRLARHLRRRRLCPVQRCDRAAREGGRRRQYLQPRRGAPRRHGHDLLRGAHEAPEGRRRGAVSRGPRRARAAGAGGAGQRRQLHGDARRSSTGKATTTTARLGRNIPTRRTGTSSRACRCRWRSFPSSSSTRSRPGRCSSSPAPRPTRSSGAGRCYEKAREPKELHVIEGATHIDLYDRPQFVTPAVGKLTDFFGRHLADARGSR